MDLHGHGAHRNEEIEIVTPPSELRHKFYAMGRETFGNIGLEFANMPLIPASIGYGRVI